MDFVDECIHENQMIVEDVICNTCVKSKEAEEAPTGHYKSIIIVTFVNLKKSL